MNYRQQFIIGFLMGFIMQIPLAIMDVLFFNYSLWVLIILPLIVGVLVGLAAVLTIFIIHKKNKEK